MTSQYDLMFDHDISVAVASSLSREHNLPAEVDDYEPGMSQVRIDPTDKTVQHGWVVCPGETNNGLPGWVLLPTERYQGNENPSEVYYLTTGSVIDLGLDLNEAPDKVAQVAAKVIATQTDADQ